MFTGIIQGLGKILSLKKNGGVLHYSVIFPEELTQNLKSGASVSIEGVCQTVVFLNETEVFFDAIEETLSKTSLGNLTQGQWVNLERAAKFGDEIGGHLLSGHIFGQAEISSIRGNIYEFICPPEQIKYFFPKGFIAIDGISLTLVEVDKRKHLFTTHLIPETLKRTTLGKKVVGDKINFEIDTSTLTTVKVVENLLNR